MTSRLRVDGLVALAVLAGLLTACPPRERNFTIVFRDAKNLRPGQFLVLKGVRVGEVTAVDLAAGDQVKVSVRAYKEFRETLCAESAFTIEKPGGMLDISGERQVTVSRRDSSCTPIRPAAVLKGDDSWLDAATEAARGLAAGAWTRARELAEKGAKEFERTPAGRDLGRAMRGFGPGQGAADDPASRLEAIRRQAVAQREQLEREGRSAEAKAVWDRFEAWYTEARKTLPAASPAPGGAQ